MNSLSVLAIIFSHHAMSANIRFLCSLALSDLLCGICAFLDDASVASILTCISVAVWPSFSPMCGQHSDLFSIWPCSIQILAPCAQLKQVRFSKTDGKNKRRWTEWRRIESNGTNISDMSGHQQAVNHWNKWRRRRRRRRRSAFSPECGQHSYRHVAIILTWVWPSFSHACGHHSHLSQYGHVAIILTGMWPSFSPKCGQHSDLFSSCL